MCLHNYFSQHSTLAGHRDGAKEAYDCVHQYHIAATAPWDQFGKTWGCSITRLQLYLCHWIIPPPYRHLSWQPTAHMGLLVHQLLLFQLASSGISVHEPLESCNFAALTSWSCTHELTSMLIPQLVAILCINVCSCCLFCDNAQKDRYILIQLS